MITRMGHFALNTLHGENNSDGVTKFSVICKSNEKLGCKNKKIPAVGFYSANCS